MEDGSKTYSLTLKLVDLIENMYMPYLNNKVVVLTANTITLMRNLHMRLFGLTCVLLLASRYGVQTYSNIYRTLRIIMI